MSSVKYIYWQEDDAWLSYLDEFPDYWTQGETQDDLLEHLRDLFLDLSQGKIPGARGKRVRFGFKQIDEKNKKTGPN